MTTSRDLHLLDELNLVLPDERHFLIKTMVLDALLKKCSSKIESTPTMNKYEDKLKQCQRWIQQELQSSPDSSLVSVNTISHSFQKQLGKIIGTITTTYWPEVKDVIKKRT